MRISKLIFNKVLDYVKNQPNVQIYYNSKLVGFSENQKLVLYLNLITTDEIFEIDIDEIIEKNLSFNKMLETLRNSKEKIFAKRKNWTRKLKISFDGVMEEENLIYDDKKELYTFNYNDYIANDWEVFK